MQNRLSWKPFQINSRTIAVILFLAGVLVRVWQFGEIPGGLNQDEAFAGYEAYSLLHYGIDSFGNPFPVYFVSWGSGMNVLESYLMIPFIAVFGLKEWVIRLPQLIVAFFSMPVFYQLLRRLYNDKAALLGLFFLAISPWHILMSRYGLESNLAPGFLLFGLYFFVLGIENSRYYLLSALFYGLSLYAYATIWAVVPVVLLLQITYTLYVRKFHFDRYVAGAIILLGLFALPLILFLMVNNDILPEIRTACFTVPKMVSYRGNEVSLRSMPDNFMRMYGLFVKQNDGLIWNVIPQFGLYYKGIGLLFFIGFVYLLKNAVQSLRTRSFSGSVLLLISFFAAVLLGGMIEVNFNRINCIHFCVLAIITVGVYHFIALFWKEMKLIPMLLLLYFCVSFAAFGHYYFTTYSQTIARYFDKGLGDAVVSATEQAGDAEIFVDDGFYHSIVLFYSKIPAPEYASTVEYTNYPAEFLSPASFGNFRFCDMKNNPPTGICIMKAETAALYDQQGKHTEFHGAAALVDMR